MTQSSAQPFLSFESFTENTRTFLVKKKKKKKDQVYTYYT